MLRRLLALKWRLFPLLAAAVIICIPFIEGALTRHHISNIAHAAQTHLDKNQGPAVISGIPIRIVVPSLAIDLPVVSQSYSTVTKTWPVAPTSANYASETAPINNQHGQSLIYGHAIHTVFYPLLDLKPGDIAYVYTANGHIFKYAYTGSHDVTPSATVIIKAMANAATPGLNLITCDGSYFQYRHVMAFKLLQAA